MQCETGTITAHTYQNLGLTLFNINLYSKMAKIEKTFNGKRFTYLCNGKVYKHSTRDYKYACEATTRQAKGAISAGHEFILSLGNKAESTYNSMARFYRHCDLEVVEIQ